MLTAIRNIFRPAREISVFIDGDQVSSGLLPYMESSLEAAGFRVRRPIKVFANSQTYKTSSWSLMAPEGVEMIVTSNYDDAADVAMLIEIGRDLSHGARHIAIASNDAIFLAGHKEIKRRKATSISLCNPQISNAPKMAETADLCILLPVKFTAKNSSDRPVTFNDIVEIASKGRTSFDLTDVGITAKACGYHYKGKLSSRVKELPEWGLQTHIKSCPIVIRISGKHLDEKKKKEG